MVVTGAASGMGRATAHLFADEGAHVGVVDRDAEALATSAERSRRGGGAGHACADCADDGRAGARVAEIRAALGPIDILVNNAGVSIPAPIDDDDLDAAWDMTLAVNLTAHARLIRACTDDLARDGEGRVVNIASTEGLGATADAAYTAAKHGVIGLTRSLAVELGPRGVNVNCVCPGPIRTGMTAGIPDEAKKIYARAASPSSATASPRRSRSDARPRRCRRRSYITGAFLVVDGGMTIRNA